MEDEERVGGGGAELVQNEVWNSTHHAPWGGRGGLERMLGDAWGCHDARVSAHSHSIDQGFRSRRYESTEAREMCRVGKYNDVSAHLQSVSLT